MIHDVEVMALSIFSSSSSLCLSALIIID